MVNISIDVTEKQLEFLRDIYNAGQYRSRSEIVRDLIRRAQFEWEWEKGIREVENKGITMDDFEETREKASKALLRRFSHVLPKKHRS